MVTDQKFEKHILNQKIINSFLCTALAKTNEAILMLHEALSSSHNELAQLHNQLQSLNMDINYPMDSQNEDDEG